jgi:hypothetical protein
MVRKHVCMEKRRALGIQYQEEKLVWSRAADHRIKSASSNMTASANENDTIYICTSSFRS